MARLSRLATPAFCVAAAIAGLTPWLGRAAVPGTPPAADAFPGWPASHEGRALTPLPLTRREAAFARDFPGRTGRFTDGRREIVLRWVKGPTRRLHPAADCFRGLGWKVATAPMRLAADGSPMSCIVATGPEGRRLSVCERIAPAVATGGGRTFPDVSSWYWHALWRGGGEAWWSVVVAEDVPG